MAVKDTLQIAKELGITLKNFKSFPGHDGMDGMDADICINGKKVLHVYDSAHGGCYEYRPVDSDYKKAYQLERELNEKIKAYGKHECKLGGRTFMMSDDLDSLCAALASEIEIQKSIKRDSKKGILLEREDGYSTVKFKAGTITKMLQDHGQKAVVMMLQGVVKDYIKKGEKILNQEYLESIGVKF